MTTEQAVSAQYAYHYAIIAAGADSAWADDLRRKQVLNALAGHAVGPRTKVEALKYAVHAAARAGLNVAAPKRPSRSLAYAERIREAAFGGGVDARSGKFVEVKLTLDLVPHCGRTIIGYSMMIVQPGTDIVVEKNPSWLTARLVLEQFQRDWGIQ